MIVAPDDPPAAVAAVWTRALVQHQRFCSLLTILTSVIRQNVSLDVLVEFERSVRRLALRVGNALHAAIPDLSPDATHGLMPGLLSTVIGLWPMTTPGERMNELLMLPEFADGALDVQAEIRNCTELLIRGALAREAR